jgi:hypothetical protein
VQPLDDVMSANAKRTQRGTSAPHLGSDLDSGAPRFTDLRFKDLRTSDEATVTPFATRKDDVPEALRNQTGLSNTYRVSLCDVRQIVWQY